jgi:hypothetical protein
VDTIVAFGLGGFKMTSPDAYIGPISTACIHCTQLLARIRQFDFGAKEVDLIVVTWPLDFLPS